MDPILAGPPAKLLRQLNPLACGIGDGEGIDNELPAMKLPLDLRFLDIAHSDALEATVRARVAHIERLCPDVIAWRVTIAQEHKHQNQGRPFTVRVDVTIPGQELAINRTHAEDVYVAVRDAFDAAHRKLEDTIRTRRDQQRSRAE